MSEAFQVLLGGLIGGITGVTLGVVAFLRRRARRQLAAVEAGLGPDERKERRRKIVIPLVEHAARVMAAYSRIIDAANAGDLDGVRTLYQGVVAEPAGTPPSGVSGQVVQAYKEYARLHTEIQGHVVKALEAGQAPLVARHVTARAEALGRAIERLNDVGAKYVEAA